MKRTLITIALTTVVVLALVGVATYGIFAPRVDNTFSSVSRSLDGGYGMGGGSPEIMMAEAPASAPMPVSSGHYKVSNAVDAVAPGADIERKIIKNADMSVVVKDPVQSMADITAMAGELGGYVVSSNLYQSTYGPNNITVPQGSISIRVPADKLDSALEQIKKSAVEVQSENVSGQDVTDQYVDLQSRLTAKQAAEKKLLEIMDKTEKAEDTMAVYAQLQQVQSDIEVLKGQIKFIDQSATLSSLNVTLIAEAGTQPIEIGGWKLQGTAKQSIQDLIRFTQGFTRFLIQLILLILPALILIAIPTYGLFIGGRAVYHRFRKTKTVVEVEEKK
jgi:hypothetical protein